MAAGMARLPPQEKERGPPKALHGHGPRRCELRSGQDAGREGAGGHDEIQRAAGDVGEHRGSLPTSLRFGPSAESITVSAEGSDLSATRWTLTGPVRLFLIGSQGTKSRESRGASKQHEHSSSFVLAARVTARDRAAANVALVQSRGVGRPRPEPRVPRLLRERAHVRAG